MKKHHLSSQEPKLVACCKHLHIDATYTVIPEPAWAELQVLPGLPEVLDKSMREMVREELGQSIVIQKQYDQQLSSQRSLQRLKIHKVCDLVR
jgi:hypothetical protein